MNITIDAAILHVLDTNINMPVLSDNCLTMENSSITNYLQKHIQKCLESDAAKKCFFKEQSDFLRILVNLSDEFVAKTKQIATECFKIMLRNPSIPRADLICALWTDQMNTKYFSFLKMNYREGFTHYYQQIDSQNLLSIISQQTLLPSNTSRVEEAFVVNLSTLEVWISEKKYEIDGVKDFYLSSYILNCQSNITEKEKLATIKKAVLKINKEVLDDKKDIEYEITSRIHNQFVTNNEVVVSDLCQEIYKEYPDAAHSLETNLESNNIKMTDTIKVSESTAKRLEKQSVKTSSGIEIKIPVELYQNNDALEFINNLDGTISLLVKNILL